MSQWDYKIDQPMPGPFPFTNSRKGLGIEVGSVEYFHKHFCLLQKHPCNLIRENICSPGMVANEEFLCNLTQPASPNIVGCNMLALFEQAFRLQQLDANTKESKDTVLESDDFPLRRSPLLFDNNL